MKSIPFSDVREYIERNAPSSTWLSKGWMKMFGTKLPTTAFETTAGILFITSDLDFAGERRYYNVRRQLVSGAIETIGPFNDYRTRQEAKNAISELDKQASTTSAPVDITMLNNAERGAA